MAPRNWSSFLVFLAVIFIIKADGSIADKVPKITLNDGNSIPAIGLGTGGGRGITKDIQIAVEAAIDAGYRHIDSAELYENEDQVGEAIAKKIREGVIKRQDIFLTTKVWNDHHKRDQVIPTLRASLEKLKLDYVDLYLIHFPLEIKEGNRTFSDADEGKKIDLIFGETDYMETWAGLEEAKSLGLAKSIGVCNFNQSQMERLLSEGKVKPAVLQVEVNVNMNQKKLLKFCKDNDIKVIGFSPLGSIPDAKMKPDSPPPKLDDPILTAIAQKYNKSVVQIVLRYHIDRDVIPIPKSTNPVRIRQNIDVFDFKLTEDEIQQIDSFNKDFRIVKIKDWEGHKYYPFEKSD